MTTVIPVSVGKEYKSSMDELVVCATGNHRSVSKDICKAVKFYMESFADAPMLAGKDKWDDFLANSTKDEILEMNTLICDLSVKLVSKWKTFK